MHINRKYIHLFHLLQKDGYSVAFIKQSDKILYLAVNLYNRQVILHYDKFSDIFEIGQICPKDNWEYLSHRSDAKSILAYSYLFKQYKKEHLEAYCDSAELNLDNAEENFFFPGLNSQGYVIDSSEYQKLFCKWIEANQFFIVNCISVGKTFSKSHEKTEEHYGYSF